MGYYTTLAPDLQPDRYNLHSVWLGSTTVHWKKALCASFEASKDMSLWLHAFKIEVLVDNCTGVLR